MENTSEWEIGAEISGTGIYMKTKGTIDCKFSHNFFSIDDAEKFAKDILTVTEKLKEISVGKCNQCDEYIGNERVYYKLGDKKLVHKNCIGDYLENNIIKKKLVPKKSPKYNTRDAIYERNSKKSK